jgi:SAM-dependent methyltransferase
MPDRPRPADGAGQFGPGVYSRWRTSSLGEIVDDLERRLLLRLSGDLGNCAVLDVGCGDGALTLAIRRAGAKSVTGCDIDPRMIAHAVARAEQQQAGIRYVVADGACLPFADRSFDLVASVTVLSFLPDAEGAVREMARVLRPGGRLVIGELGRWSLWAARRRVRGWLGSATWRAATFRTAAQVCDLARSAGLSVEHVSGAIFFPPWLPLARLLAPWDSALGERTTVGAAFIAVRSRKA